jgi:hypothetical protein
MPLALRRRTAAELPPSADLSPQEKGWDVGQTIEKLLQTGARLSTEAHEVVRVPGLLTDADMIGGRGGGRGRVHGGRVAAEAREAVAQARQAAWRGVPLPS